MQVDDVALGEELRDARGEDSEVRPRILGRLRSGVAGDPQDLSDLQLGVLRELAEETHRTVFEVRERAVGRARAPEAVERPHRVGREVDGGKADHQPRVREFGDLLRQQGAARIAVAVVPAPARRAVEVLREPGDIRRLGEVRRAGDDERAAVLPLRERVDPRTPGRERRTVRRLLSRRLPDRCRIVAVIGDARVAEDRPVVGQVEPIDRVRHGPRDLDQPVADRVDEPGVLAQHTHRHPEVRTRLLVSGAEVLGRRLVNADVLHAVARHERLTDRPERLGVHGMR